ncbi:hypothetical protein H6CHR_02075 [Variovorax sp. PBL-H6]|uniref:hypothetical protein n=1 Tax=Variovorax sp. PBL-H6 TaxID=434009 RepID=UPI00131630E4|nr:hypothetical protein [Variovorax sp. PBL-H6]VTU23853.1 hypothetical protein H6CHR_02075 [Variovorax sp. PBL-H6]
MFGSYKKKIEAYCEEAGIEVPIGFDRHSPGRYVAIDLDSNPPKLVATTWSNAQDAVHYMISLAAGRKTMVLDFLQRRELTFNGKDGLVPGKVF